MGEKGRGGGRQMKTHVREREIMYETLTAHVELRTFQILTCAQEMNKRKHWPATGRNAPRFLTLPRSYAVDFRARSKHASHTLDPKALSG